MRASVDLGTIVVLRDLPPGGPDIRSGSGRVDNDVLAAALLDVVV
jgi:hypothetical protein